MENANSPEYLEKIKGQVIENLKRTAFAPSVAMTDVPRESLAMEEDEEAALDDQDEDDNKDARFTQRRSDKHISRDDELSESEDEELDERNGIRHRARRPRRRNIMDYPNPHSAPDYGLDSGMGSPSGSMVGSADAAAARLANTASGPAAATAATVAGAAAAAAAAPASLSSSSSSSAGERTGTTGSDAPIEPSLLPGADVDPDAITGADRDTDSANRADYGAIDGIDYADMADAAGEEENDVRRKSSSFLGTNRHTDV